MTPDKATALRGAAERATPGPWEWREADGMRTLAPGILWLNDSAGSGGPWGDALDRANAAYIALADPPTILALLAERERLRGALEGARDVMLEAGRFLESDFSHDRVASVLVSTAEAARQALEATDGPS